MTNEEAPKFTEAEVQEAQRVEYENQRTAELTYLQNRVLMLNIELQRAQLEINSLKSQATVSSSE